MLGIFSQQREIKRICQAKRTSSRVRLIVKAYSALLLNFQIPLPRKKEKKLQSVLVYFYCAYRVFITIILDDQARISAAHYSCSAKFLPGNVILQNG